MISTDSCSSHFNPHACARIDSQYRGADKSLAGPGRKQANVSVRMAPISFGALPCRKKENLMTARVSMLLISRASLTCFRACFPPGRSKDLSARRYIITKQQHNFAGGSMFVIICVSRSEDFWNSTWPAKCDLTPISSSRTESNY
jgi:hypothetical protein